MGKEYNISKAADLCAGCGAKLSPGQEAVAAVCQVSEELARTDYCAACWTARGETAGGSMIGFWRFRFPEAADKGKKNRRVDERVLIDFFHRLAGETEPARINFRFVLALILMRKKLLVYDRTDRDGPTQTWIMRFRGSEEPQRVAYPQMTDDQIAEAGRRLAEILPGADDESMTGASQ